MFGAQQSQFLLHRRQEDEIALGLDAAAVEGAEHFQRGHQVGGVVAHAGRAQYVAFALHLQVGAFGEYGVHVGGEDTVGPPPVPLRTPLTLKMSSVRISLSPSFSISARMYLARACSLPEGAGISTSRIHSSTMAVGALVHGLQRLVYLRLLDQRRLKPAVLRDQRQTASSSRAAPGFLVSIMRNDTPGGAAAVDIRLLIMFRHLSIALLMSLMTAWNPARAQAPAQTRPRPRPKRRPHVRRVSRRPRAIRTPRAMSRRRNCPTAPTLRRMRTVTPLSAPPTTPPRR